MKLSDLSKNLFFLLIFIFVFKTSFAEQEVDIWDNKNKKNANEEIKQIENDQNNSSIFNNNSVKPKQIIQEEAFNENDNKQFYGIWDPDKYNFDLTMWANTDGQNVKKIVKRINKLNLSETAEIIFQNTMFSFSYAPENLLEKDFLDLKVNWLIKNNKDDLVEKFLEKNEEFPNKKKIIQYLVDRNISSANIKLGCEKVNFIGKDVKDPYLEKFKIYCLVFNNKKNQAQLLHDILKEQKKSDKFFDNSINFLLGLEENKNQNIKDDNLLNFYLSSITIPNFKYEPSEKTKKTIWEYLNAANLITVEDISDKNKIRTLELAAQKDQINKNQIFNIYKKIPFDINSLVNAENVYQSLDDIESRALIYQRFLLSDNSKRKLDLLFLLKDLFKKAKLVNVYSEFLSDRLKEFDNKEIPKEYEKVVERNILQDSDKQKKRIKYDDKTLHKSKLIRYFFEEDYPVKKTQKELDNIFKKIKRNRNYFYSAKDLAVLDSLKQDGIKLPKEIEFENLSKNYSVPNNLIDLVKKNEKGFLALKIVEIIGEDEVSNLDSETIYFLTYLLNRLELKEFRNTILSSALPLRT
jgi:hypothetical protein|tara:strand:+ start:11778 stop:13514 length:1737 start_codon:yes stop_codon:yes gene_type:complete